ncbi:MAG: hypothetical protein ACI9MS_002569, partial [Glaciecola sp.]
VAKRFGALRHATRLAPAPTHIIEGLTHVSYSKRY